MDHLQFCYWLQGYFEIGKPYSLNKDQVEEIKNHLDLVFKKVTPSIEHNDASYCRLNTSHSGLSSRLIC